MKVLDSAVMPVVVTESDPSPSLRIHAKGRAQMIQNPRSMSTKISNVFRNEGFMFLAERQKCGAALAVASTALFGLAIAAQEPERSKNHGKRHAPRGTVEAALDCPL